MAQRNSNWELLRDYVERGSEQAFARLVALHVDMVYSAALRQVRRRDLAEEVTQVVFIVLARKAKSLRPSTIVPAWLYRTAHYAARNVLKMEARRAVHERKAAQMASENERADTSWRRLCLILDHAVARLNAKDQTVITLRFFQHMSMAEIGQTLGISEDAAGMRVSRAVERLREFFRRRGVTMSAASLGGVIWINAVQAAPAGLDNIVAAGALQAIAGGAGFASILSCADAVNRALMLAKAKAATLLLGATLAVGVLAGLFGKVVLIPMLQRMAQWTVQQDVNAMLHANPYAGAWTASPRGT